jgi:phospholipid/cholesterol/gamma-HCH transport system substrate-binding protein
MPPNKKTVGFKELRVGIVVVASIGILIFLILNASGDISPFSREIRLKAKFPSAEGLRSGSEVRLAGVRVGKVEDVILLTPTQDPNSPKVEAILAIDSKIDGKPATDLIRTDSVAQLGSPGMLGTDKIISIVPGTSLGQPIKENDTLKSSAETGFSTLTASTNDLVQQLNSLTAQVNQITNKVKEGEGSLGLFINDEAFYNNLNAAIRDLQDITNNIRAGEGSAGKFLKDPEFYNNLNKTVVHLQTIAEDLQRGRGTAGKFLTDDALYNEARSAIGKLNKSANEINGMIADIRAGNGTVGKLITDEEIYNDARAAIARLNTTAERIDSVIAGAQRGEGTLGKLITDERLYNNVNQLSSESVKLLYDFRQNPKKYLTVKFELF